jgi:hypothetical protein
MKKILLASIGAAASLIAATTNPAGAATPIWIGPDGSYYDWNLHAMVRKAPDPTKAARYRAWEKALSDDAPAGR